MTGGAGRLVRAADAWSICRLKPGKEAAAFCINRGATSGTAADRPVTIALT